MPYSAAVRIDNVYRADWPTAVIARRTSWQPLTGVAARDAGTTGHAAFDLRYDSFMSLPRTLALLLTAGALLDGAIAADAPGSSPASPPAKAMTSRAVMTGEQVVRI